MHDLDPRVMIIGKKESRGVDVTMDPRLSFYEQGVDYMKSIMSKYTGSVMSTKHLNEFSCELTRAMKHCITMEYCEEFTLLMDKPKYQHDCSNCVFLGHRNGHDLYFCHQGFYPTLISRYGNSGECYKSGAHLVTIDPDIWSAAVLAEEMQLGCFLHERNSVSIERR